MSNRHRSSKQAAPGATHLTPNKEQRRAENRKARHRTHELLAHADMEVGEEIVTPRPHHTGLDIKPEVADEPVSKPGREYRHWKQKFWKRRSNQRAERAAMAKQEPPLPEMG